MKLLPQSSVHLLSSGQVVTSVVSIVKELVENAVDAEATKIEVKLEKFGFDKIEIQDNGVGIPSHEAPCMALPHYTSKITSFSDVDALTTYGFRGEALSSISAVADLSVVTKTAEDSIGTCYKFSHSGGLESSKSVASCTGTTVAVTNLFKNVPVRRQICKNEKVQKRDLKQVEELLMHFGIAWPQTRFSLYHNRCLIWSKTSVPTIDSAISQVCGSTWVNSVQKIQIQDDLKKIKIEAFIPKATQLPSSTEGERSRCFTLINGRPVIVKEIDKLLRSAFLQIPGLKDRSHALCYCVVLTVPPNAVDVNLEPNKTKVMLQDKENILSLLGEELDKIYNNNSKLIDTVSISGVLSSDTSSVCMNKSVASKRETGALDSIKSSVGSGLSTSTVERQNVEKGIHHSVILHKVPQDKVDHSHSSINELVDTEDFSEVSSISAGSHFNKTSISVPDALSKVPNVTHKHETLIENTSQSDDWESLQLTDDFDDDILTSEDKLPQSNGCVVTSDIESNFKQDAASTLQILGTVGNSNNCNQSAENGTITDSDMVVEGEDQRKDDKRKNLSMSWSKGTVKDSSEHVMQPVQLLNPLLKRPPSPTVEVGPRSSNPRKKKCTDSAANQPTLYTLAQKQPAKEHLSAYTLFARSIRLEVMNDNPSADFSRVSQLIYEKWQNLSEEGKKEFEMKADSSKTRRTFKQKLVNGQVNSPKLENAPTADAVKHSSKNIVRVKVVTVEFTLNNFRAKMAQRARHKAGSSSDVHQKGCQYIGPLETGYWVYCQDGQLALFNHMRAKEIQLFFHMMANYKIPTKLLDCPLILNESLVGGSQCWAVLMRFASSPGVPPCYEYIDDPRLLSNGIKVKKWRDLTTNTYQAEIVALADCMAFFGVKDLIDVIQKFCTNEFLTLEESRPLKIISYFKEEAVRMVRQLPLKIAKDDVLELNHRLETIPLLSRTTCLHGHPLSTPIFRVDNCIS